MCIHCQADAALAAATPPQPLPPLQVLDAIAHDALPAIANATRKLGGVVSAHAIITTAMTLAFEIALYAPEYAAAIATTGMQNLQSDRPEAEVRAFVEAVTAMHPIAFPQEPQSCAPSAT